MRTSASLRCCGITLIGLSVLCGLPGSVLAATGTEMEDLKRTLDDGTLVDAARQDAADRLSKTGSSGATILMSALKSPEAKTREIVIRAIGDAKLTNAVPVLLARLQDVSKLQVPNRMTEIREIITALGKIGDKSSAQTVFALQHEFFGPQTGYYGGGLSTEMEDLSKLAANVLVQLSGKEKTLSYFLGELDSTESRRRNRALVVLGSVGDRSSVRPIILRLGDTDQSVRQTAAKTLVAMKAQSYDELKKFVEGMERQGGYQFLNEAKQALQQVELEKRKEELTTGW